MKFLRHKFIVSLVGLAALSSSCDSFFDINDDPSNTLDSPLANQLTSLTVNVGYAMGSDLNRYGSLIMQQYSGQSTGAETQTQLNEKYQISGQDANNVFSTLYASILNDANNVIVKATAEGSPHYAGVAKILTAYTYQVAVDTWGDLPYSETQQLTDNLSPAYDDDEEIYTKLIALLDEGINDVKSPTSIQSPATNSTIYPGTFVAVNPKNYSTSPQARWVKFANVLKLRLYLHYSEKNPAFATERINAVLSLPDSVLFQSNADNFAMSFVNAANSRNPIDQMETGRAGYLVANFTLVDMMNTKADPRRTSYFTQYPANSGQYLGAKGGAPNSQNYSKFHVYLRGTLTGTTYSGAAPIRMLTFAEYNFIRAEASLRFGSPGSAETFYRAGITASMTDAGVANADITTYLGTHGTLSAVQEEALQQIIEEKFVASYGVALEPWTDWRRTGYPVIAPPVNAVVGFVPRSLYYPQNEVDFNSSLPGQKSGLDVRIFWDTRP